MSVVAVIPARGGSKGVPLKNLARVGGRPLVARAVDACRRADLVDMVVVSTDHDGIAAVARDAGATVVERPADLGADTASSESVLLHALDRLTEDGINPQILVFVQCTSPFIDPADLDDAVRQVRDDLADSVFSAVETYEFLWHITPDGARGVNHDHTYRPRRQDRAPHYRETGAFYVLRVSGFREHQHRFFGRIAVQQVNPAHAVEVDSVEELDLACAVARALDREEPLDVDAVVTDFDGVHTDDRVYVDQDGRETVVVNRGDGMGVSLLLKAGIRVCILSTEVNSVVRARARKLGVPVMHGLSDKRTALLQWMADEGLDPARVAYVGNDVNDLGCLAEVGWPIAVPDSHPDVLAAARLVLTRPGGSGAVREICERVLAARKG
ncbi:acylneuraminate cytidylyltransferase [Thermobifida fusca]|uniref:acylneuraminate cytidylyltransferase n=1 Tax=Thermobifida fusca TaxID=2021 RepID=UPI00057158F6|nr:acylneuraminate cytidylyltransferase [Thermobifida fusca]QOS59606.1 acylneuraminate cytidylyltransferase [Thermobifida fusca]